MAGPWKIGEYRLALAGTLAQQDGWDLVDRPQTLSLGLVSGWLRQSFSRLTLVDICSALGTVSLQMLDTRTADTRISETVDRAFRGGRLRLYKRHGGGLGGGGGTGGDSGQPTGSSTGQKTPPPRPKSPPPKRKTSIGIRVVDEDGNAVAAKVSIKLPDGSVRSLDLSDGHDYSMIANLEEGGSCEVSLPAEYDVEWKLGRGDSLG